MGGPGQKQNKIKTNLNYILQGSEDMMDDAAASNDVTDDVTPSPA